MEERTIVLTGLQDLRHDRWRLGWGIPPLVPAPSGAHQHGLLHATYAMPARGLNAAQRWTASRFRASRAHRGRPQRLPGVTAPMPAGAFYAFDERHGMTGRTFADRMLNEAGVSLLAGSAFGQQGVGSLRVSYANSQANLRAALTRMGDLLAAG
jgi:aspartate/methionine/tyrosine aminotransferase